MHTDIIDLRDFYLSSLGLTVRRLLRARLRAIWPNLKGETTLVLGYGAPLMRPFLHESAAVIAMMPAAQGVAYWPREGPNLSALVDFNDLPLEDSSVDRIILAHALEAMTDSDGFLREVYRVLKPGGRLLAIVPNRHGVWAHNDRTPFGHGQPYSSSQLRKTLRDHGFMIERSWSSLYFPPTASRIILSLSDFIEKYAERVLPPFGGLLLAEASKQVYAAAPVAKQSLQKRLILPLPLPEAVPPLPAGRTHL